MATFFFLKLQLQEHDALYHSEEKVEQGTLRLEPDKLFKATPTTRLF